MSFLKKILGALNPQEQKIFWTALVLAALSLFVLVAVYFQSATTVVPREGGEYTEGLVGQPTYVNPVLAATEADRLLVRLLFSNVPALAEKTEMDKTGRSWRVRLRENLTWSDGHKLTSDDIIFTIQKIQNPETQSPLFSSWQGVAANRLSELEIQFNLVAPYPFFLDNLRGLYVLPKHLFAETPPANWRLSEYNLQPVGSGPYLFHSFEKQPNGFVTAYHLRPNQSSPAGPAFIERFNLRFFSRTEDLIKAFNTGTVDGFGTFDPGLISEVNRSYQLIPYTLPSYYGVFFNQSQNLALQELAVRKALSDAADRKTLVEQIFQNRALALSQPIPPPVLDQSAESPVSPDWETINQELESLGWKRGEDGYRVKAVRGGSIPLTLTLTFPQVPFLTRTAEELKSNWEKIGVRVSLEAISPDEVSGSVIKNRDYQALLYGNILNPPRDFYSFWHSSERFYPGLNLSLYSNKRADQLIEAVRRDFDTERQKEGLQDLAAVISNEVPAVFLYSPNYLFLATKSLNGPESQFLIEPADWIGFAGQWYVKTTRALKSS